jgi:hypothetical protein
MEDVPFEQLLTAIAAVEHDDVLGGSRIDVIAALEQLVRHATALQLEQVAALHAERAGTGMDATLTVAGEVAMARGVSPSAGGTQLGHAVTLAAMPSVMAALRAGRLPVASAHAVSRECGGLGADDVAQADAELAPHLHDLTPRRAADLARHVVVGLDPEAAHERAARARADKRVELSPEPDGVAALWVRGPAEDVLTIRECLWHRAETARSAGDVRSVSQIMFDTLLTDVTGFTAASKPAVELQLVLDAPTLLGDDADEPVELVGYGPLTPAVAEQLVAHARDASVRRLLTDPVDGVLVARDPRRRRFTGSDTAFVRSRDGRCRQPGCDCRVRHVDHVRAFAEGGPTVLENAQGLCVRSHTTKHLPGWSVQVRGRGRDVEWTTPTGHRYRSSVPPVRPPLARLRT